MPIYEPAILSERARVLREALEQLLHEVIEAGFETATDYNWPKAIADAKSVLERTKP